MMTILTIDHIVTAPDVCFGKPHISGTRTKVKDIVGFYYRAGWPVATICEQFNLTPGQVFAALSYYEDHRAELDADMHADAVFSQSLESSEVYRIEQQRRHEIERKLADQGGKG